MEINQSLKTVLKRLKLSGLLATLPDRVAYAKKANLSELEFLELALHLVDLAARLVNVTAVRTGVALGEYQIAFLALLGLDIRRLILAALLLV